MSSSQSVNGTGSCSGQINVCFMIDRLKCGGTEKQLVSLIEMLDRVRVAPSLVLLDGTDEVSRALEPTNIPVLRLGVTSLVSRSAFNQLRCLVRFLRDLKVHVLQSHFADSTYFGIFAAKLAQVPYIVKTRRDLCYWTSRKHKLLGRPIDILFNRFVVDAMLVNSDASRDAVVRDEWMEPKLITLIENGIHASYFSERGESPNYERPCIAIVAMLRPEKRLQDFILAAPTVLQQFPNARFEIVGEGEEREYLESLIRDQNLESSVFLLGKVDNIPDYLGAVDVAVLCSETESMPNAILEYMAAGKPIVATRVGGICGLLEHEASALLTEPLDPLALANSIVRVLSDPALAKRCRDKAQHTVASRYRFDVVARKYEDFYTALLSN